MKKHTTKKHRTSTSTRVKRAIVAAASPVPAAPPPFPRWYQNVLDDGARHAELRRLEEEYKARDRDAWRASLELVSPGGKEIKTIASIGTLAVQAMCGAHMEGATPLDFARVLLANTANEMRLLETRAMALPGKDCEYFFALVKRLDASVQILDRFTVAHKGVA